MKLKLAINCTGQNIANSHALIISGAASQAESITTFALINSKMLLRTNQHGRDTHHVLPITSDIDELIAVDINSLRFQSLFDKKGDNKTPSELFIEKSPKPNTFRLTATYSNGTTEHAALTENKDFKESEVVQLFLNSELPYCFLPPEGANTGHLLIFKTILTELKKNKIHNFTNCNYITFNFDSNVITAKFYTKRNQLLYTHRVDSVVSVCINRFNFKILRKDIITLLKTMPNFDGNLIFEQNENKLYISNGYNFLMKLSSPQVKAFEDSIKTTLVNMHCNGGQCHQLLKDLEHSAKALTYRTGLLTFKDNVGFINIIIKNDHTNFPTEFHTLKNTADQNFTLPIRQAFTNNLNVFNKFRNIDVKFKIIKLRHQDKNKKVSYELRYIHPQTLEEHFLVRIKLATQKDLALPLQSQNAHTPINSSIDFDQPEQKITKHSNTFNIDKPTTKTIQEPTINTDANKPKTKSNNQLYLELIYLNDDGQPEQEIDPQISNADNDQTTEYLDKAILINQEAPPIEIKSDKSPTDNNEENPINSNTSQTKDDDDQTSEKDRISNLLKKYL